MRGALRGTPKLKGLINSGEFTGGWTSRLLPDVIILRKSPAVKCEIGEATAFKILRVAMASFRGVCQTIWRFIGKNHGIGCFIGNIIGYKKKERTRRRKKVDYHFIRIRKKNRKKNTERHDCDTKIRAKTALYPIINPKCYKNF